MGNGRPRQAAIDDAIERYFCWIDPITITRNDKKLASLLRRHLRELGLLIPVATPAATNRALSSYKAATGEEVLSTVRRALSAFEDLGPSSVRFRNLAGLYSYLNLPIADRVVQRSTVSSEHGDLVGLLVDAMASAALISPALAPSLIRLCFAARQYRKALALSRQFGSDIGVAAAAAQLTSIDVFCRIWLLNCGPAVKICRALTGLTGVERTLGGRYVEHYAVLAGLGPSLEPSDIAILTTERGLHNFVTRRANLSDEDAIRLEAALLRWKSQADDDDDDDDEEREEARSAFDYIDLALSSDDDTDDDEDDVRSILDEFGSAVLTDITMQLDFVQANISPIADDVSKEFQKFRIKQKYEKISLWHDESSAPGLLIHDSTQQILGDEFRTYVEASSGLPRSIPVKDFGKLKPARVSWPEFRAAADHYLESRRDAGELNQEHRFTFQRAGELVQRLRSARNEKEDDDPYHDDDHGVSSSGGQFHWGANTQTWETDEVIDSKEWHELSDADAIGDVVERLKRKEEVRERYCKLRASNAELRIQQFDPDYDATFETEQENFETEQEDMDDVVSEDT